MRRPRASAACVGRNASVARRPQCVGRASAAMRRSRVGRNAADYVLTLRHKPELIRQSVETPESIRNGQKSGKYFSANLNLKRFYFANCQILIDYEILGEKVNS